MVSIAVEVYNAVDTMRKGLGWYHAIVADAFNDTTAVLPKG